MLEPGDALYLPRGTIHAAEALGETSIHLTVGVHPLTRYTIVQRLLELAQDSDDLRSSLPMGVDLADPAVLAAELDATVAALREHLGAAGAETVARSLGDRLRQQTRPEPIAPLAQLAAAGRLDHGTPLRLRAALRPTLEESGEHVTVDRARPHPAAAGRGRRRDEGGAVGRGVHARRAARPGRRRPARGGAPAAARGRDRRCLSGCRAAQRRGPQPRESINRCALHAQLRGDPMLGTAFPAARVLLVEQPGPWGRAGLRESRFDAATRAELEARAAAAAGAGAGHPPPGPHPARARPPLGARRHPRGPSGAALGRVPRDDADLLELPLDGSAGTPGRRSALPGLRAQQARHLLRAARPPGGGCAGALRPGRVWECSHVGGERFAANVLMLPSGLLYGRVLPFAAREFVAAAEAGEVIGALLRGRIGYVPVAQAALAFGYEHLGIRRMSDLQVLRASRVVDDQAIVRLAGPSGELDVQVQVDRVAADGLTCANPSPGHYFAYRPVRITPASD